jgi:hypothetical protein
MTLRCIPGQCEDQATSMLSGADAVTSRCIDDGYTSLAGCRNVYIVHSSTSSPYSFKFTASSYNFFCYFSSRPDYQTIIILQMQLFHVILLHISTFMQAKRSGLARPGRWSTIKPAPLSMSRQSASIGSVIKILLSPKLIVQVV